MAGAHPNLATGKEIIAVLNVARHMTQMQAMMEELLLLKNGGPLDHIQEDDPEYANLPPLLHPKKMKPVLD